MITIPLTRGLVAVIDDCDAHLAAFKWTAILSRSPGHAPGWYAHRAVRLPSGKRRALKLHRVILAIIDPCVEVDHIDGDGLNCRRSNLRTATRAENMRNRGANRNNGSGYKGVSKLGAREKWQARILYPGHANSLSCGVYDSAEEAARAYDAAARRLHGSFARLNFPDHSASVDGKRGAL